MMTRNPLEIVGIEPGSSEEQLKRAYRARALDVHPDHGGSREEMAGLNEAYEWLRRRLVNGCVPRVARQSPVPQQVVIIIQSPVIWPTSGATTTTSGGWPQTGWPW